MPAAEPNKRRLLETCLVVFMFVVAGATLSARTSTAQTRDHLTDPESELVRFHQELDKRIEVFIRAIDRRFAIINGIEQPKTKKLAKDEPDWGDLPKGTRAELIDDIAGILDEAITNIDDVARRDEKNPLIPRATRKLSAAATNYVNQLTALSKQTKNEDELSIIDRALDNANQIIEVGSKMPEPAADKKKKKG
jgi:hypothetical protein